MQKKLCWKRAKSNSRLLKVIVSVICYSIPYVASTRGYTNCLNCHDVAEGDVLGVVSLNMDITQQYQEALRNTIAIALFFVLFAVIMAMVSQFKQIIENDRTLDDVYSRFQQLLEKQLHFSRYSFYEVSSSNNRLNLIFSGGPS